MRRRERAWIAEMAGEIVGSVFLVKKSDDHGEAAITSGRTLGEGTPESAVAWSMSAWRFCADRRAIGRSRYGPTTCSHAARSLYEKAGFRARPGGTSRPIWLMT